MKYAVLFSNAAISAQFDAAISRDAQAGRVNAQFRGLLQTAYGVTMPAAPVAFVEAVNAYRTAPKMERFTKGTGAVKGAIAVHEALASLVQELHDGGRVNNLPALAATPAWMQPKPAKAKAKADDTEAAKAAKAAKASTEAAEAPTEAPAPGADLLAEADSHIIAVIALAKAGELTAAQKGALLAALEGAMVKAEPKPKRAKAKPEAIEA